MHEEFSLTGNECALYHYLLKRSNSSNWRNPIEVMNSVAIEYLNLKSFRDVQASRDKLALANLLQFRTLNGSKFVSYSLFDVELQTFAPIAKVLTKVTAKVSAEVVPKVTAEVIENTIVLLNNKPKPKHLIKDSGGDQVKSFNLRGHLIKRNAGDVLVEKFEARLDDEFMKEFRSLDMQTMLVKFNTKAFLMNFSDENHLFNSFKKLCKDELAERNKPGSKENPDSIIKTWGGT